MPRVYRHRINTLEALASLPADVGLEFDLRSSGNDVLITHDPFTTGPTIEEFFPKIGARPCIFNVKCEGIEERVGKLAAAHGISDYFFLDCSVPAAVKLTRAGERRFAVRYSEMEPKAAALAWAGKAEWLWVDCFKSFPGDDADWLELGKQFRICLVSPELQGHDAETFSRLRAQIAHRQFDAICTKDPSRWSMP